MDLRRALRVGPKARLALVGAGGKTTTLFELGQALVASGQAQMALLTTTTHLGAWQVQDADHHMALENSAQVDALGADLPAGVMVCTGAVEAGDDVDRLPGLAPQVLDALRSGRTWLTTDRDLGLIMQAGAQWSGGLLSSQAPASLIVGSTSRSRQGMPAVASRASNRCRRTAASATTPGRRLRSISSSRPSCCSSSGGTTRSPASPA